MITKAVAPADIAGAIRAEQRENFTGSARITMINDLLELHARAVEAGMPVDVIHHHAVTAGLAADTAPGLDDATKDAMRVVATVFSDLRGIGRI